MPNNQNPDGDPNANEGTDTQYIASTYDGLPVGPGLSYSFENQAGVPYDGTNKLARLLSPFTFRFVVPEVLVESLGSSAPDVNLIGRATKQATDYSDQANQIRANIGIPQVTGSEGAASNLTSLRSTLSAGQALSTLNGTTDRAVLTDLTTVADIQYQVEKMLQMPPLTLFVNPNSLSISYSTVQQFTNRTRYGYIFERWGEGQVTLSISGSTGAFVAGNNSATGSIVQSTTSGFASITNTENDVPSGVQFASKRDSAAFQQLMKLFHTYMNNGYIYDTVGGSEAHLMVGAIAIDYDQMTYVGNIDSFSYSYDEGSPHRIEWSMEFTVGRMYDHAEEPMVVTPQSTPTPGIGGMSDAELMKAMAGTPSRTDIETGNPIADFALGFAGLSGTEQFQPGEGQTPLDVVGAYFLPTGLLG
jgi:hypothetical protein